MPICSSLAVFVRSLSAPEFLAALFTALATWHGRTVRKADCRPSAFVGTKTRSRRVQRMDVARCAYRRRCRVTIVGVSMPIFGSYWRLAEMLPNVRLDRTERGQWTHKGRCRHTALPLLFFFFFPLFAAGEMARWVSSFSEEFVNTRIKFHVLSSRSRTRVRKAILRTVYEPFYTVERFQLVMVFLIKCSCIING